MSQLSDMMGITMDKVRAMADANTVIGNPITTPGGVTILPISKVSYGFGGAGGDASGKSGGGVTFGGGAGAGVTIQPLSFLIVKGESVRMLPVAEPASTSLDRIIEQIPDLLDRLDAFLDKRKAEKAAVAAAEAELEDESTEA